MSSEGLSRRGLLAGGAALALAAAVPVAATMAPEKAEAQTATRVSTSGLTKVYGDVLDAGGDAAEFSDNLNHIGIVVYYGAGQDPVRVGDAFANELLRRGVNARSFAAPISGSGTSVLYQIGPSGLGPLGVNTAASSMSRAIELSQARDRLLSTNYTAPAARGG